MTTYVADPFRQVEAQFRWITQQRATGQLDEISFRNALSALRIQDAQGRWWTPQEGTGAWLVWNGAQWLLAAQTPAPYPPTMPGAPPMPPAPASPYGAQMAMPGAPGAAPREKSVFGQSIKYLFITLIIFGIIGVVIVIASKGQASAGQVFAGVGVAALLSWLFTIRSLSQSWEGQVVDVRVVRERHRDSEGDVDYEDVRYATIRQPSGKMRRERALADWQVGNYLRKAKGENWVRKVG